MIQDNPQQLKLATEYAFKEVCVKVGVTFTAEVNSYFSKILTSIGKYNYSESPESYHHRKGLLTQLHEVGLNDVVLDKKGFVLEKINKKSGEVSYKRLNKKNLHLLISSKTEGRGRKFDLKSVDFIDDHMQETIFLVLKVLKKNPALKEPGVAGNIIDLIDNYAAAIAPNASIKLQKKLFKVRQHYSPEENHLDNEAEISKEEKEIKNLELQRNYVACTQHEQYKASQDGDWKYFIDRAKEIAGIDRKLDVAARIRSSRVAQDPVSRLKASRAANTASSKLR